MIAKVDAVPHVFGPGNRLYDRRGRPVIRPVHVRYISANADPLLRKIHRWPVNMIVPQNMGDLYRAFAVDRKLEDAPHYGGRFFVYQPMMLMLRVFFVSVDFMVRGGNPCPGPGLIRRFLLPTEVTKIKLVRDFSIKKGICCIKYTLRICSES